MSSRPYRPDSPRQASHSGPRIIPSVSPVNTQGPSVLLSCFTSNNSYSYEAASKWLTHFRIFRSGTKFDKDIALYDIPILKESLFSIASVKEAKRRKDMLQPHFSKAALVRSERMIHDKIAKFLKMLQTAASENKAIDLSLGFSCLAADVVTQYCYQQSFGALDAPDFRFPPILAIEKFMHSNPYTRCFPSKWDSNPSQN